MPEYIVTATVCLEAESQGAAEEQVQAALARLGVDLDIDSEPADEDCLCDEIDPDDRPCIVCVAKGLQDEAAAMSGCGEPNCFGRCSIPVDNNSN